ncbi:hypothetical protein STEG23_012514 [Scotinomys teguina]
MDVLLLWSYWLEGNIREPRKTVGMTSWVRGYRAVGVKRFSYSVRSLEKPICGDSQTDKKLSINKLAQKNREELDKYWSQQTEESTKVVTTQSTEIRDAEATLTDLRCTFQALEINLEAMKNQKVSLENSLRDVEARDNMKMEQLEGILLHPESGLAQTQAEGQHQTQKYEALLNIKVKLEAEIVTYHRLLENEEDFSLNDALDSNNSLQTVQRTTTHKAVNGKVVSETNNTRVLRH